MRELDSLKIAYHSIKEEKLSMWNANRSPELQNMQVFLKCELGISECCNISRDWQWICYSLHFK